MSKINKYHKLYKVNTVSNIPAVLDLNSKNYKQSLVDNHIFEFDNINKLMEILEEIEDQEIEYNLYKNDWKNRTKDLVRSFYSEEDVEKIKNKEINLIPIIGYAISKSSYLHGDIDNIYNQSPQKYYNAAIQSEWFHYYVSEEMNILEQRCYRRVIGILENKEENYISILQIMYSLLRKGYKKIYQLFKSDTIDILESLQWIQEKFNHPSERQYHSARLCVLYLFAVEKKIIFNETINQKDIDSLEKILMLTYNVERTHSYPFVDANNNEKNDELVKSFMKRLLNEEIIYAITSAYPGEMFLKTLSFDKFTECDDIKIRNFLAALSFIFAEEKLEKSAICGSLQLNKKDISNILNIGQLYSQKEEDILLFFIMAVTLKGTLQSYNTMKKLYLEDNKETLYPELDHSIKEIEELKKQLKEKEDKISQLEKEKKQLKEQLKEKNSSIKSEVLALEKKNSMLEKQLREEEKKERELHSLRNFVFSLNNSMDTEGVEGMAEDNVEIIKKELNNKKGVIIGGHPNWQKKMKQELPWEYIPANTPIHHNTIKNYDVYVINFAHFNHSSYYSVINYVREHNKPIIYINTTNTNRVLYNIYEQI